MPSVLHTTVSVDLPGREEYLIHIGAGLLDELGGLIRARRTARRAAVITDSNVEPLYADRALASLAGVGIAASLLTIPAGESSKTLGIASELYDALVEVHHARDEPIIALGGGVVGDVAGFVAGTWLRGVPFVQCPTTVEADVDASVGGKTAVNHAAGKNLIGAFHQPMLVCIDVNCLSTLTERDFRAGLAESVKHALIADAEFLDWHEQNATSILARDPATLVVLIKRNCEIKATIVAADERETSTAGVGRAAINLGHTIGHALEAQSGYALRHGEAVSIGLVAALELAVRMCGFAPALRDRIVSLLVALSLPTRAAQSINSADLLARLSADKKSTAGRVRFVLPAAIGSLVWAEPSESDIRGALDRIASR